MICWRYSLTGLTKGDIQLKYIASISAALVLAACGDSSTQEPSEKIAAPSEAETFIEHDVKTSEQTDLSYNEDVWYISGGWPGEYPTGFSVLESDVTLMGRAVMHEDIPKELTCPLEQNATIQQWNVERVDRDNLTFVTVSEKFDFTITAPIEVDSPSEESSTLLLYPDDKMTYLRYLGEGWAVVEFKGEQLSIDETVVAMNSDLAESANNVEDNRLWVEVPCGDQRGWLLYNEVLTEFGIVTTPIIGYGESRDLTEEDRKQVALVEEIAD